MKTKILISLLLGIWMGASAFGQDPVTTSPQYYKVLLENNQVRVLEYRLKCLAQASLALFATVSMMVTKIGNLLPGKNYLTSDRNDLEATDMHREKRSLHDEPRAATHEHKQRP